MYCSDNPLHVVRCYAMLDKQSNKSLSKPALFTLLGIDGEEHEYSLNSGSGVQIKSGRNALNCVISSIDGSVVYQLPPLIECQYIPNNRDEICSPQDTRSHSHLSGIAQFIPEIDENAEILLLQMFIILKSKLQAL